MENNTIFRQEIDDTKTLILREVDECYEIVVAYTSGPKSGEECGYIKPIKSLDKAIKSYISALSFLKDSANRHGSDGWQI